MKGGRWIKILAVILLVDVAMSVFDVLLIYHFWPVLVRSLGR